MIVGDLPRFAAVSIGWHEDADDAREAIAKAIASVQHGDGVLIVTDMFGGTPSNLAMTFLAEDDVEVVTGANLPMLIKLATLTRQASLLDAAREIREDGRNAIWVASDLLRSQKT
jgi:PTS system mannose-specific IIA component